MASEHIETKNLWQQFSDRWLNYPSDDPDEAYKGYIMSVITVAFTLLAVLATLILVFGGEGFFSSGTLIYIPVVFVVLYILIRLGYLQWGGILIVVATGLFSTDPIGDITSLNRLGFLVLVLTVVLSGLLITPKAMFVTAIVAGGVSVASIIINDNSVELEVIFIGIVYLPIALVTYFLQQRTQTAFSQAETYAKALEQARDNLEVEVFNRTHELQTSFNITGQINNIIVDSYDQQDLFENIAELILKAFNLSHILIYTVEQASGELTLQHSLDSTGQAIQQSRNLETGFGIVNRTVITKQLVVIDNLNVSPPYTVSDALLPEMGTEMAIPLKKGEVVLGVLYLHNQTTSFTEAHKELMQIVANQLAIALDNLQLVSEVQAALVDVEVLNERLLQESWDQALRQKQVVGYMYTRLETRPLAADDSLPQIDFLLDPRPVLSNKSSQTKDAHPDTNEITIPVKLRGQMLGVLNLNREKGATWNEDEQLIVQSIAEQIALALDSARLFEDTQRNAWRDQLVSESTAQVWSTDEIEEVMKAAVAQLGDKLDASEVVIRLGTETELGQE